VGLVLEKELQLLLSKFIQYCNELDDETIFIVEGKRDTKTLRLLGLTGKIIEKGQRPLDQLVDIVFKAPVIVILTDFDREGKYSRRIITKEIQHRKRHGKIDNYARQLLYKFCRAYRISEIEDLDRFASNTLD
jgi:5S rRNA maturation endonuclease (ribonuclease M5)